MSKKLLVIAGLAGCIAATFAAKKDPTIMTVGNINVPLSEFEYLYNKNAQQQIGTQTIDEYAEMFKTYKLKVADALAEGIDTTQAFQNEFNGYRQELAQPYLTDSAYIKSLMQEAYSRMSEEVEAIHIMLFKQRDSQANRQAKAKIDSIHSLLLAGDDFADLAKRFSQDRSSAARGGNMGYITSSTYPYNFETAAYTLKEGQISDVVESPQGYHILLGGKHRPARGTVLVQHILKLVPDTASQAQQKEIKHLVDSIYSVAVAGADFDNLALLTSEDPGSARKGGMLPWFGSGRMVAEFDSAAFALPVGAISTPVRTRYGWHIIKKLDERPVAPYQEVEPQIKQAVNNPQDARAQLIYDHFIDSLKKKYNYKEYPAVEAQITDYALKQGVDSLFFQRFIYTPQVANQTLVSFADQKHTVGEFAQTIVKYHNTTNPASAAEFVDYRLQGWKKGKIYKYEDSQLANEYPEFKNLTNEYRDGMLLFEVSNRKVWEKASQDTEGLNQFFQTNKSDYTWSEPYVKGFLIQTTSEDVSNQIRTRLQGLPTDSVMPIVRQEFAKEAKIDKVLAAKGDNPLIDARVFGGPEISPSNATYTDYFIYDFKLLTQPEEVGDVKGQVTGDYQNLLEQEWVQELREKYPITVNEKELSKLRKASKK